MGISLDRCSWRNQDSPSLSSPESIRTVTAIPPETAPRSIRSHPLAREATYSRSANYPAAPLAFRTADGGHLTARLAKPPEAVVLILPIQLAALSSLQLGTRR